MKRQLEKLTREQEELRRQVGTGQAGSRLRVLKGANRRCERAKVRKGAQGSD